MKKFIFAALLAVSVFANAANPTAAEIQAYKDRAQLYINMKQKPDQVVTSLKAYFGKPYFYTNTSAGGWNHLVDIQYQIGSGNEITFLETVATIQLPPDGVLTVARPQVTKKKHSKKHKRAKKHKAVKIRE